MPATTCMLCHGPIHLSQEDLKAHHVPTVGYDCRQWLSRGLGLEDVQGIAFSLEQMLLVYCLEAAVEAGHIGQAARDEADRMIGLAIQSVHNKYTAKLGTLPASAPILEAPSAITEALTGPTPTT